MTNQYDWRQELKDAQPILERLEQQVSKPGFPLRILRVNQLDANMLDNQFVDMLKTEFMQGFQFLPVRFLLDF